MFPSSSICGVIPTHTPGKDASSVGSSLPPTPSPAAPAAVAEAAAAAVVDTTVRALGFAVSPRGDELTRAPVVPRVVPGPWTPPENLVPENPAQFTPA